MLARIFLLEDDPASRELITYLLKFHGHVVEATGEPEAALDSLSKMTPDLIISDLQLNRWMNGYDLAHWCREQPHLKFVPIICVSASMRLFHPDRIKQAGFTTFIAKPIEAETFVRQVESYLPIEKRALIEQSPRQE